MEIKFFLFKLAARVGLYDYNEINFIKLIVKNGDIVVDGGANFGIYAELLRKLVGREGQVLAYEPLPFLCTILRKNLNFPNLIIREIALSNEVREMDIWIPDIGFGLLEPALASVDGKSTKGIRLTVKSTKLDDEIKELQKISFMKLDLEGHEFKAIEGAEAVLRFHRPIIQFEENMMDLNSESWIDLASKYSYKIFVIGKSNRKLSKNFYLWPNERVSELTNRTYNNWMIRELLKEKNG